MSVSSKAGKGGKVSWDGQDDEGRTALLLAAVYGQDGCLKLLLEAGCDKEAKDKVRDECGVVVMTREIVVLSCNG